MKYQLNKTSSFIRIMFVISVTFLVTVHAQIPKESKYGSDFVDKTKEQEKDSVLAVADKMPEYPGGKDARFKFLADNIRYPVEAKDKKQQGRVIVQFVVSKTGKVKNAKVVKSISPTLDKEALRVVNSFPDWIPGEINGQKVSVYQLVPVTFKLIYRFTNAENPKIIVIDKIKMPSNFDISILNPSEIDTGYVTRPVTTELKNQLIQKYGIEAEKGVIEVYTNRFKKIKNKVDNELWDTIAIINPNDKNAIYPVLNVNKVPEFIGGNKELYNFIKNNLKYPDICRDSGIQGTAIVQFVVDTTGKVKEAVVKNKIHTQLAAEAIRVINSLPNFIPGEKQGEKVNVRITFPIKFTINGLIYPLENDTTTDINSPPDRQLIVLDGHVLPFGFDLNWLNLSDIQSYKLLVPKDNAEEKEFKLRFGPFSSRGVFVAFSKKYYSANRKDRNGNKIYDIVEQMPQFSGGEASLNRIIEKNLIYPPGSKRKSVQGAVIVRFVVNNTGQVETGEIVKGLDPECDKEAIRLIKLLRTWIPGKQAGENVSVWYTLPITFKL